MPRRRSSSPAPSSLEDGRAAAAAAIEDRYGLLAENAYKGVVSSGFATGADVWMSDAAMVEASICISQLVFVSVSAQPEESRRLKVFCNAQCASPNQPGGTFAAGFVWPSKTVVRNGVRLSKRLAQSLGFPSAGSVIFISSLELKRNPAIEQAAVVRECRLLSLQVCEGSFLIGTSDVDTDSSPLRSVRRTPDRSSPLKNLAPDRSCVKEVSSAAAKSALKLGSKKMKEVIEKLAARWLKGSHLLVGNMVMVPVCGSECVFHVKAAESFTDDLSKFEDLSLESSTSRRQSLYLVSGRTSVNLVLEEEVTKVKKSPSAERLEVKPHTGAARSYASLGGLSEEIAAVKEIVDHSLLRPHVLARFGLKRTKGVLLYGPPGTGKTSLAQAVASEAGVKMFVVNGPEIVTEYYGESEAGLKAVFDSAAEQAPSVVFIDELDAITPERKQDSEALGQRLIATLLTLMDGVHKDGVLVIAATNRPESIDPALRRHGRFDYEIEIGVPTPRGRLEILQVHLSKMKHDLTLENVQELASSTHGFVGADLLALCNEAALTALRRYVMSRTTADCLLLVSWEDFELARGKIRPSAMREVILEVPKVGWNDIGGQNDVKQQLKEIVEWPHKHSDAFARIGTTPPKGVLLYGPPGCSKTLMARAVAAEAGLNFIAVKGPELFSKWVGESEKAVRALFTRAKAAAPSVVFFDEIDGLAVTRSSGGDGVTVEDRVLSQLLVELDGVTPSTGVSVIAATNRPDKLDPALLRPGRFDRLIYVGHPDCAARKQIFDIHLRNTPYGTDVSTAELAARTELYTGADIAAVCREAALAALENDLSAEVVLLSHFEAVLTRVLPRNPTKCDMELK